VARALNQYTEAVQAKSQQANQNLGINTQIKQDKAPSLDVAEARSLSQN
jgi:hypothetical protein